MVHIREATENRLGFECLYVIIPLCGYVAIIFFKELDKSVAGLRVLTFFLVRRRFFVRLLAERKAIRNEIVSLGKESPIAE